MVTVKGASETIKRAVLEWAGVECKPHRFGGLEFSLGAREIGHVHGDSLVDIPFPTAVRHEIVAAGEAEPHHILPRTGWVSLYLREEADVGRAIALLERSYRIATQQRANRKSTGKPTDPGNSALRD